MASNFTSGMWNGMKVEFGKVYSNLNVFAFNPLNEAGDKKLRVFDFDDTLVQTNSHIYVTDKNNKKSKLTPGEYAVYEPKKGDKFDFSDFDIFLCFFCFVCFFILFDLSDFSIFLMFLIFPMFLNFLMLYYEK